VNPPLSQTAAGTWERVEVNVDGREKGERGGREDLYSHGRKNVAILFRGSQDLVLGCLGLVMLSDRDLVGCGLSVLVIGCEALALRYQHATLRHCLR
jgi:hypothetical protein